MRQRGFTLLEVLIAFTIAAIAVAALLQGASGGLQNARTAAHYQEAVARAQSRLALLEAGLQPGEQNGDDGGGFQWRVTAVPGAAVARRVPASAAGNGASNRLGAPPRIERTVLYAVTVVMSWGMDGGTRQVSLMTQRLGVAPPEPP